MKKNVGKADATIREILGIILIGLGIYSRNSILLMVVLVVLGLIAIITGLVGFCSLYTLLGISTVEKKPARKGRKRR